MVFHGAEENYKVLLCNNEWHKRGMSKWESSVKLLHVNDKIQWIGKFPSPLTEELFFMA